MISGYLDLHLDIIVPLRIRDANGQNEREIDAVLDTGFDDYLTLPPEIIAQLSLPFMETIAVTLADGSMVETNLHLVQVVWDGVPMTIRAQEAAGGPLLGMLQLFGSRVTFDVENGGAVAITSLQTR